MKTIVSALAGLAVAASLSIAPASATFNGNKADTVFKKMERNLP
jgi:hypothetical protein